MAGIYIHIPFCKQACHYCDFYFSTSVKNKDEVIDSIIREIEFRQFFFEPTDIIDTIYFGGGTPSIINKFDIYRILNKVYSTFNVSNKIEFTIEANPDDLTLRKLKELNNLGVNRLSIGIQSFDNYFLKMMNRSHSASDALDSILLAQQAGFSNISIDLMYGLPNQKAENWINDLKIVSKLNIHHLSCYCLTVEEKTALSKLIKEGKIEGINENNSNEHFALLINWANENKFEHYEISNFAKQGFRSIHNTNYWLNQKYLGLGPSAHSYNGYKRLNNIKNNGLYIKYINTNKKFYHEENLTNTQKANEFILTNLRTIWGIDIGMFEQKFGKSYKIELLENLTMLENKQLIIKNNNIIMLTQEGKYFADYIASELFFT